jgi:hypothetical protein
MKAIIISALVLIPLIYLFSKCTGGGKKKVYYTYGSFPGEKFFPGEKNSPSYNPHIIADSTINDPKQNTPLFLDITFSGEYQYYPEDVRVEVYYEGKKLEHSGIVEITVATVVTDFVQYYKLEDSIYSVSSLIAKLKKEKSLPDSVHYFKVSGHLKRIPLGNTSIPDPLKIKVKLVWDKGSSEKEYSFGLGERQYGSPSNRPFG